MKSKALKKTVKCDSKNFCNTWKEMSEDRAARKKGLSTMTLISIETLKRRTIPIYRQTTNGTPFAVMYCPWCGGSFVNLHKVKLPKRKP